VNYVHLGRLGLRVSPLCLGTMNFGWDVPGTDDDEAFRIMDRALEQGINFFDTSSAGGSPRAGAGASVSCSRRRSTAT
jgi:aryl-alcohol dehydrogenase-like predicted oxidoreductase